MYTTISTPAATRADSAVTDRIGQVRRVPTILPFGIVTPAASAINFAANQAAGDGSGQVDTRCPDDSLNFTAAVTSISMGRMVANRPEVAQHASIDELASALRAA